MDNSLYKTWCGLSWIFWNKWCFDYNDMIVMVYFPVKPLINYFIFSKFIPFNTYIYYNNSCTKPLQSIDSKLTPQDLWDTIAIYASNSHYILRELHQNSKADPGGVQLVCNEAIASPWPSSIPEQFSWALPSPILVLHPLANILDLHFLKSDKKITKISPYIALSLTKKNTVRSVPKNLAKSQQKSLKMHEKSFLHAPNLIISSE